MHVHILYLGPAAGVAGVAGAARGAVLLAPAGGAAPLAVGLEPGSTPSRRSRRFMAFLRAFLLGFFCAAGAAAAAGFAGSSSSPVVLR